jgi:8-oxo-dGTP diphosphatase
MVTGDLDFSIRGILFRGVSPRSAASAAARPAARRATVAVDVVLLTPLRDRLGALLRRHGARGRERWTLPWDGPRPGEAPDACAARVASGAAGGEPSWLEQAGAHGGPRRHPGDAELSLAYVGAIPLGAPPPATPDLAWHPLDALPALPLRHQDIVAAASEALRRRLDQAPIAFRLLPPAFTLSELQQIYELLLGRRLHKASFRRALQAAWLVDPTDEWRSEGRGRPAQLFRYAPRRRRGGRRGVRFDLLGG